MKFRISILFAALLLFSFSFQAKKTLKGTVWKSSYFKYDNYYHFETDTSGFLETTTQPFEGKPMTDKDDFSYKLAGDTLKLLMRDPNEIKYVYVKKKEGNELMYVSIYEFALGKEQLKQVKK